MTGCVPEYPQAAMRHDPASAAVGMAQDVTDLAEQGTPAFDATLPFVSQILKTELAQPEVRSTACHVKTALSPAFRDLSGIDFAAQEFNLTTRKRNEVTHAFAPA